MAADILTQNDQQVIHDYREFLRPFSPQKKRALLSYLTFPVVEELNSKKIVRFSNSGIVLSWVRVLNELGYIVDIINWDDKKYVPQREYDLVIFHGGKNFNNIYPALKGKPKIIHFLTGSYWKFNNAAEDERLANFKSRHGLKLNRDRYIMASEDAVNTAAAGIILIGNNQTKNTYSKYPLVIPINIANYPDNHFKKVKKNYSQAKNNFLFFAGGGNIHKGLDLVIEAFAQISQNLYIVTPLEKAFLNVYKKESTLDNIHLIDTIPMRTEEFYEIADKCAFQIFPSCSEGQPGSVTEGMLQGLIPIVSKESGLDAESYGVVLKENTVDCIKNNVKKMSALGSDIVATKAKVVHKEAVKNHNPKKFRKDLRGAIGEILRT